jgi:hypothetical protein
VHEQAKWNEGGDVSTAAVALIFSGHGAGSRHVEDEAGTWSQYSGGRASDQNNEGHGH